jgi:hypothetical protein
MQNKEIRKSESTIFKTTLKWYEIRKNDQNEKVAPNS